MKYPKLLLWSAVIFISIFILAPAGFAQGPIKLGAIFPLADITGDQGAKAMKLAVKEINIAGGLLGRQVELIVVDDEMKPEKGAAAVEKLPECFSAPISWGWTTHGAFPARCRLLTGC